MCNNGANSTYNQKSTRCIIRFCCLSHYLMQHSITGANIWPKGKVYLVFFISLNEDFVCTYLYFMSTVRCAFRNFLFLYFHFICTSLLLRLLTKSMLLERNRKARDGRKVSPTTAFIWGSIILKITRRLSSQINMNIYELRYTKQNY